MSSPDDDPEIAAALAAAGRAAPPPDAAFLAALRDRTAAAFAESPPSPRGRSMRSTTFRWLAAVAALLVAGVVLAHWIGEANKIAVVPPLPPDGDDKFLVAQGLTDDGRVGKLADAQGVVSVKPALAERWSPAGNGLVLKPGDQLRTDDRGANAAALRLLPGAAVTVGPHSTVELTKPGELKLVAGEMELAADSPVSVAGPNGQTMKVEGRKVLRLEMEKLVAVAVEPLWLKGYKGTTTADTIGSLIATVDGRNEPLTVGFHRVTVDIRDQIARTVVEESFVNNTNDVLEGVFHFPLPADASISGFGMWIGDQLVEADVVEKQRAREIYETILREKRDPGLLEWAGGNVFKARVYPIPARGEKRIRISYTQVLPLVGTRYRYAYALQSEMLKAHPLRELTISVTVNSAPAIKAVSSPTHDTRQKQGEHAARVEFSAQAYTPTRDFEAVVELAGRPSDVAVLPHRRGSDGYFMVQLTPPGGPGGWERPLVPDGGPLKLLLLADTSASMDRGQRATQNAMIAALLGSLTPKDTINAAGCDVACDWAFEKPLPATAENVADVRDFLAKRQSLGWTDLDKAFAAAMAMGGPGTHTVYLGDGIGTARGDADPAAFAKRLARLVEGKGGTFHAVALGSSYEATALKAIATLGGGSVRHVTGERGPAAVAADLLGEIAAPTLRDAKVEVVGVRTARLYPEVLPNVPAGTQQTLLGRYLPEGKDQRGEIVVTGTLAGRPVRFTTPFELKDAEAGNAFLPRLWARRHLDALLDQGATSAIREEIIGLSEEFNILTPYTSLLVLETDADRERFAVKRRFRMADGERFFVEGREAAAFELRKRQLALAADHRTALRRKVLEELKGLGRDTSLFTPRRQPYEEAQVLGRFGGGGAHYLGDGENYHLDGAGAKGDKRAELGVDLFALQESAVAIPSPAPLASDEIALDFAVPRELDKVSMPSLRGADPEPLLRAGLASEDSLPYQEGKPGFGFGVEFEELAKNVSFDDPVTLLDADGIMNAAAGRTLGKQMYFRRGWGERQRGYYPPQPWGTLIPALPAPARERKDVKTDWPAAALALSESLLRADKLAKLAGGLAVTHATYEHRDGKAPAVADRTRLELVSPGGWLVRSAPAGGPVAFVWCDAKEYAAANAATRLGRTRPANDFDRHRPPLALGDGSIMALHAIYAHSAATVETVDKDRAMLMLKAKDDPRREVRVLVDTTRHVILGIEYRDGDRTTSKLVFGDFVEVAGMWWARSVESRDGKGKVISATKRTVEAVPADDFAKRVTAEKAAPTNTLFLAQPLPRTVDAKAAIAAGKATADDRAALVLHFAASQQWPKANEQLAALLKVAAGKPGLRWLTNDLMVLGRWHEDLRSQLPKQAAALVAPNDPYAAANGFFLANLLFGQAEQALQADELVELFDRLEPFHKGLAAQLDAHNGWRILKVDLLRRAGRGEAALALAKALAEEYRKDVGLQVRYARHLADAGETDAGLAWLAAALKDDDNDSLRYANADLLASRGRYRQKAEFLVGWITRNPTSQSPYAQYLTALALTNQAAEADQLAAKWLAEGRGKWEELSAVAARLNAAVAYALGQGYGFHTRRVEDRWSALLAETALAFARGDTHADVAESILNQWRFRATDAGKAAIKSLAKELTEGVSTLPGDRVHRLLGWVGGSESGLKAEDWKALAATLRPRWQTEMDAAAKVSLAETLLSVLGRLDGDGRLDFIRELAKVAPPAEKHRAALRLFDALLERSWTAEREAEALALIPQLAPPNEPADGLVSRLAALHRFTDAMIEARYRTAYAKLEHPEKLTRPELQKKQAELQKQAREGVADLYRAAAAAKLPPPFARWVVAERLWIEIPLDRELKQAASDAWGILDAPALEGDPLDAALRGRAVLALTNLAARKGADPELIARLKAKLDAPAGKGEAFRLLMVLDKPEETEAALRKWSAGSDPGFRWRLALGELLAERGRLTDAASEYEAVLAADELAPDAHRKLADWYAALGDRPKSDAGRVAADKTTDEGALARRLNAHLRPWRSARPPTHLDAEVIGTFAVLFSKSATPENYLGTLGQFYGASRDFRLLAALAEGVTGRTANAIYPLLSSARGVLVEVRDEAAADELAAKIAAVRKTATTPTDLRALDLLEVEVERRAAQMKNQPGPHAERALAAMKRAFDRAWTDGEPRRMAEYLAGFAAPADPPLAGERLRELDALRALAPAGSFDRLEIARHHAEAVAAGDRAAALDALEAALKEYAMAHGNTLPGGANAALGAWLGYAEAARQYARADDYLKAQLARPVAPEQRAWLERKRFDVHLHALRYGGEVADGKGEALFITLRTKLVAALGKADPADRPALVWQVLSVCRVAHQEKIPGAADVLRAFATDTLPGILMDQSAEYDELVRNTAQAVRDVRGPRDAVAFLVARLEKQPDWARFENGSVWGRVAEQLSQWWEEAEKAKTLGDVEPRLLAVVLAELRRELRERHEADRVMYHRQRQRFWAAKADDFAKVAEEVVAEKKTDGERVYYVANYLFEGLGREGRAIEMLAAARTAKILDEHGEWLLANFLQRTDRHAEAVPVLADLVARKPDDLTYRVRLMRSYFKTGKADELRGLLKATDAHLHTNDRWGVSTLSALGDSTLENKLFAEAAAYFDELIPLAKAVGQRRTASNISRYYSGAADAHAGLGNMKKAVEMASAAIVLWPAGHHERQQALDHLKDIFANSPGIAEYAKALDAEPMQSAVVRKALGRAYLAKNDPARAVPQLRQAADLQPNDANTFELLVEAYDKLNDPAGAVKQLRDAVEVSRRSPKLFGQLGERLAKAGQAAEAERAFTAMVELSPLEAEGHAALAEVRQNQGRWGEAITHWRKVAELKAEEPTGLLKLAAAQVHEGRWAEARESVKALRAKAWESRFNNVAEEIRKLEQATDAALPGR